MNTGQIIRRARSARTMTQGQLAHTIGVDQSYISKVEQGERQLSPPKLKLVSQVLGVPYVKLLGLEPPMPGNGHTDESTLAVATSLQRWLMGIPPTNIQPVPADQLALETRRIIALRRDGKTKATTRQIARRDERTGTITTIVDVAHASMNQPGMHKIAVDLLVHGIIFWLRDVGAPEQRTIGAAIARRIAEDSGHPTLLAVTDFGLASASREIGELDVASACATRGIQTDRAPLDVRGTLYEQAAMVAALDGRISDADAAISEAADMAARIDTPATDGFSFGPICVHLKRLSLCASLDLCDDVIRYARGLDLRQAPYTTRRAAALVDQATAWAHLGQSTDAVGALREAYSIMPNRVIRSSQARGVIAHLLDHAKVSAVGAELARLGTLAGITE